MAEDQRPPGTDVVEIVLAVGVPHARAGTTCEEARRATDRAEGANRRIDAAGNDFLGLFEELVVARGHDAGFLVNNWQKARLAASGAGAR